MGLALDGEDIFDYFQPCQGRASVYSCPQHESTHSRWWATRHCAYHLEGPKIYFTHWPHLLVSSRVRLSFHIKQQIWPGQTQLRLSLLSINEVFEIFDIFHGEYTLTNNMPSSYSGNVDYKGNGHGVLVILPKPTNPKPSQPKTKQHMPTPKQDLSRC